ncbi:MAG: hypothetical protein JJU45_03395 [Acidimicrobiia bacterium]|nr:hypothetical protein [Acidimicrobiia bacterium]
METRRWINQSLPQTLYIASILLYLRAGFLVLFGAFISPLGLALIIGSVAGGYGLANEKRWGYIVALVVAAFGLVPFALAVVAEGIGVLFELTVIINLIFPVALFVALVHPMSREYQRIWFS